MNAAETKERITTEFITKYYEWLRDLKDLPDREYGYKYFYGKPKAEMKDNQKALIYFNTKIFKGRWEHGWIKNGYDPDILLELAIEGFLSHKHYWGRQARLSGNYDWYFITQERAKEIYKERRVS